LVANSMVFHAGKGAKEAQKTISFAPLRGRILT
jgi:hypothetical protein